jgi:chromosome partitioning protein
MLTIACLSQKGGVGKSTLCRLIATAYAKAGWRVKIADFNTRQKTSTDWAATRMSAGLEPEVAAEAFTSLKGALAQDYDLMVFDGRPDSDTSTLEIARVSELVVIPVGVSIDDLQPQARFAHELRSKGIEKRRIVFAINKSVDSLVALEDARDFIQTAGYRVFKTDLPMRTGFQIAQNAGRAIFETAFPSLNERANALTAEVIATIKSLSKEIAK